MADIKPRAYWDNLSIAGAVVVDASSELPGFPIENLDDQRRSKVWASAIGWNIVQGKNDVLDFTESVSGAAQAVITPANYPNGTLMAAAAQTAMNTAATDNSYTVTYDAPSRKFTITRTSGAATFDLNHSSGPGSLFAISADLGFDIIDDIGLLSYVSDNAVQKSAEWVEFDLQSSMAADAAIVVESNIANDPGGVIKVQAEDVGTFLAPTFEQTLIGGDPDDLGKLVAFFLATETFRFWRIFVEDRDNSDGFSRLGFIFIGPQTSFNRTYDLDLAEPRDELSEITFGDQGAIFTDIKPSRRMWQFVFRDTDETDRLSWRDIANAVKIGTNFFFAVDPLNFPLAETVFGYVRPPGIAFTRLRSFTDPSAPPEVSWTITMSFGEAVG